MMKHKPLYNYKDALNVPYMVQKIWKGFSLENPIEVTKFAVFGISIILMLTILKPVFALFNVIPGLKLAMQLSFPVVATLSYDKVEPDGLKIHEYGIDSIVYFFQFRLRKKSIYQDQLVDVEDDEKIVFDQIK